MDVEKRYTANIPHCQPGPNVAGFADIRRTFFWSLKIRLFVHLRSTTSDRILYWYCFETWCIE